jgi:Copper type II ascorbate-dependent monooxygenase, C-terminal domain
MRMRRPVLVLALGLLALPVVAGARGKTLTLKFPRFEVPPHSDREVCTFIKLPMRKAYDAASTLIANLGGDQTFVSHHFLMWQYTGADMAGFPAKGQVVDGKACLDFGPSDRNSRLLLANSQVKKKFDQLLPGLAQRIEPTAAAAGAPADSVGLILNTHWINGSDRPHRASVKIRVRPAKSGTVRRYLKPIFGVTANGFIDVGPGEVKTVGWSWGPGVPDFGAAFLGGATPPTGPACVYSLTTHTHKRGKLFEVNLVRKSGERTPLLETLDYSDPTQVDYNGVGRTPPPFLVSPGDVVEYKCTHDNGVTTPMRLGCEEEPGKTPGQVVVKVLPRTDGAAKTCKTEGPDATECPATDPAYPGRTFTGNCVPANLVFGFTSNDDMCIMPGAYFDPNPDAPAGSECDLSLLPPLS